MLFFTGFTRTSHKVLKIQKFKSMKNDIKMFENLDEIKIGYQFSDLLENDLQEYAKLMNYHWKIKQKRSKGMTNKN